MEGTYRILNVLNLNTENEYALDDDNVKPRGYLKIHPAHNYDAQVWNIRHLKTKQGDKSYVIFNRATSTCASVANGEIQSQRWILCWEYYTAHQQFWDFIPTGESILYKKNGKNYPIYKIACHTNNTYVMDAKGIFPGAQPAEQDTWMQIYSYDGGKDQHWILVPDEDYDTEGVYEIIPMWSVTKDYYKTDISFDDNIDYKCLSLDWNNSINSTALMGRTEPRYNDINQKFFFKKVESSDGDDLYKIRPVRDPNLVLTYWLWNMPEQNRMVADQEDTKNESTPWSKWSISSYGTCLYNGQKLKVVAIKNKYRPDSYWHYGPIDSNEPKNENQEGVRMLQRTVKDDTKFFFILRPTTLHDYKIPTPYGLHITDKENTINYDDLGVYLYSFEDASHKVYPRWNLPKNALSTTYNFYLKAEVRKLNLWTNEWTNWEPLLQAEQILYDKSENGFHYPEGIDVDLKLDQVLALQLRVSICAGYWKKGREWYIDPWREENILVKSFPTSKIINIYYKRNVDITKFSWTPEKLQLDFNNDPHEEYTKTYTRIGGVSILSIKDANGLEYLAQPFINRRFDNNRDGERYSKLAIPMGYLNNFDFQNGKEFTIKYAISVQNYSYEYTYKKTIPLTIDDSNIVKIEPVYEMWKKFILKIKVPKSYTNTQCWLGYSKRIIPIFSKIIDEKYITFYTLYPFGQDFYIYFNGKDPDNTGWTYAFKHFNKRDTLFDTGGQYPHIWIWENSNQPRVAIMETLDGSKLHTEVAYSMDVEQSEVFGSKYKHATKNETLNAAFTATGCLLYNEVASPKDFQDLLEQDTVLYESPNGDMAITTVSNVKLEKYDEYYKVDVSIIVKNDVI